MKKSARWIDYGHGVSCIDTELFRSGLASCYLMIDGDEAAFIDTGTRNSLPLLMQVLSAHGVSPGQVRWVMPTHVHLDHAGGAGALMQQLPNATLLIHERGAAHMINPEKLQAGSLAVYGEARYEAAFGSLVPVPASRVQVVHDGDNIRLGLRELAIIDTPGHARHHYVVWDRKSRGLFCGDSFGVSYPELNDGIRPFIFPPSTPVQFDPSAWHSTINRLMEFNPACVYLTHFGKHENVAELAADLHTQIDAYVRMVQAFDGVSDSEDLASLLMQHSVDELASRRSRHDAGDIRRLLSGDMDLNAQGLLHWIRRGRAA
ncbi:MAG: MBL fold metallo-hydrolase [Pseudohongiella sp.]|nr:MBL fold metallo-hydrolase [Pseudohongiella sp.]MDO9519999.1 MBL fold metallo-hydrolase [Pseudohongiella sp.]